MKALTDIATLRRALPLLAHTCDRLGLVFGGVGEGYADLPPALLLSDALETSPAYRATLHIPAPWTVERIEAAVLAKRAAFARAKEKPESRNLKPEEKDTQVSSFESPVSSSSWGDPEGGDSGTDYARS